MILYSLRWLHRPALDPNTAMSSTLTQAAVRFEAGLKSSDSGGFRSRLAPLVLAFISESTPRALAGQDGTEWQLPVMRWFMLTCLKESGAWCRAKEATSPLAAFQWCMRVIVYDHLQTIQASDAPKDEVSR